MNIITWFKIRILREVVFVDGKPVDCHGLRFKGGLPFNEGTEYYIDKTTWEGWDYFGKGVYCTPKGFKCDLKNPYYIHKLNKTFAKFGKEVKMNLNPEHIKVSLVQADHEQNLGQWSMQTYSGVVIYHEPTKIMVSCTKHKSQWKNKCEAMEMLESKLTESIDKVNLMLITSKLDELKSSLGRYKGLTLEDYDILYGDVEEIQYLLTEVTDENTTNL